MSWTIWIALGSVFAGLGVGLGAFGAHALRSRLTPEDLAIFEVGVRYQMYHALALLAVGLVAVKINNLTLTVAGISFAVGILIFSGSLYTLVLSGNRALGMVTPVGGAAFIIGWATLLIAVLRPALPSP